MDRFCLSLSACEKKFNPADGATARVYGGAHRRHGPGHGG
jgi:hypothetical protein